MSCAGRVLQAWAPQAAGGIANSCFGVDSLRKACKTDVHRCGRCCSTSACVASHAPEHPCASCKSTPALRRHAVLPARYMTDEHFWHVYFTLARKHLPEAAYSWGPDNPLPSFEGAQPPLQMQMQDARAADAAAAAAMLPG